MPRRALVTGGATRLGRGIVLALARHGFDVAIHYKTSVVPARELLKEIESLGVKGCLIAGDLQKENMPTYLIEQAKNGLGGEVNVLVNNASIFNYDSWDSASMETWQHHMDVNVRTPFFLMQEFARHVGKGQDAMILNMIDQRVWSLTPHFVTYTLSKSALWTLTQTMALALAPRHIRVNAIAPGPTMPSARQTYAQFEQQCRSVPLGHGADCDEIGRAVMAFLSLPSVTGQMLALDGGQHMQWSPESRNTDNFHE